MRLRDGRIARGTDAALLHLLLVAFGRWPAVEIQVDPIEHLRWKASGLEDSAQLHRITEVDGRIASSVFCIVQRIKVRDGEARSILATDRCVHPDFQRRGLAQAIGRWRRKHPDEQPCDIQFGVQSPHPALQRIRKRVSSGVYDIANELQAMSLALRPRPGEDAGDTQQASDPPRAAAARAAVSWDIVAAERFDKRIDDFWRRAAQPFDFIVVRTEAYMNWRYADPRAGRFAIRLAEEDDELLGYAVLRISHGKGYIADMLALPGRLDVVRSLIDDAVPQLWELGAFRVDCWLPAVHPYQTPLREAGFTFRKRPAELDVNLREMDIDVEFLAEPDAAIHVVAGDTDLV